MSPEPRVLDDNMPKWRSIRDELNHYPLAAWEDLQTLAR